MATAKKRKSTAKRRAKKEDPYLISERSVAAETLRGVWGVLALALAVLFTLAGFGYAGTLGDVLYNWLSALFGIGYALVPLSFVILTIVLFRAYEHKLGALKTASLFIFFLSALAFVEALFPLRGGLVGKLVAMPFVWAVDIIATVIILLALIVGSLLIALDTHPQHAFPTVRRWFGKGDEEEQVLDEDEEGTIAETLEELDAQEETFDEVEESEDEQKESGGIFNFGSKRAPSALFNFASTSSAAYTPPPLSLLQKDKGKPSVGDVKANANTIKRTLKNFGIDVEMDEVSIGPTVTQYAIKPAEGVRLAKIVSLQSNLELALAATPIRIEAPIPGKALVGVEVPNSIKSTLGLASLLGDSEFQNSDKPLLVALGRDIAGTPHFTNIAKMPHMLIAGATGAGKSVTVHDLIISLLYRRSPAELRIVMVDPKRVELTQYNGIPHLLTPVITDAKKAILALKWLSKEMDRRYDILEAESVRDIGSYHKNVLEPARANTTSKREGEEESQGPEPMPYIVAIIDEMADLMSAYPRELEAAIVRIAQMSRAVGIHLVLSTQRPSVQIITGLIKANIPSRIALQVSSQIDSRTILDMGGAEKLLGAGDMLYLSGEMSKPRRIQAPFISETEVKKVVKFLSDSHISELPDEIDLTDVANDNTLFAGSVGGAVDDDDDELYEEARAVIIEAGKGSTSYLQRKLKVGYARAARLMDILEERGVIGPPDGSKPREVLIGNKSESEDGFENDGGYEDEEQREV